MRSIKKKWKTNFNWKNVTPQEKTRKQVQIAKVIVALMDTLEKEKIMTIIEQIEAIRKKT